MDYIRCLILVLILFIVDFIECLPTRALEQSITIEGLMTHLEAFQSFANEGNNNRLVGTKGHQLTLDHITSSLKSAGYKPQRQCKILPLKIGDFNFTQIEIIENTLIINDGSNQSLLFEATLISGSPGTPQEGITGNMVSIGNACSPLDSSRLTKPQQPWIALAKGRNCSLAEKVKHAQDYGAHAILFYEYPDRQIEAGISAGTISTKTATNLLEMIANSSLTDAKLKMINNYVPVTTYNIIAETKTGDKSNVVMMGAHSDSVSAGPGINDDGAGVAAALEIATHINKSNLVNAVRFCWWTGEEEGLKGSKFYMQQLSQQDKQKIALYLNADMIASPNYVNMVYDGNESQAPPGLKPAPHGSLAIQKEFERYFDGIGEAHQLLGLQVTEKKSDAYPFYNAMIPTGGTSAGFEYIKTEAEQKAYGGQIGVAHDPCYHKSCDTLKNINPDGFLIHARGYAHLIEMYSHSTAGLLT